MKITIFKRTKLANEAGSEGMVGIANEWRDGAFADGAQWICLSPLGDFPHARGTQRIDKGAVEAMANQFNSFLSGAKRALFGGVPFYIGHPDVPGMANEFPDRKAYGWVKALEARSDGLHGQIEWSEPGKQLLANKHYKYFSPYWDAKVVGLENGKTVYQPTTLLSVGLTNQPNLPVKPLANERKEDEMQLPILIALLGLANTASEQEATTEINRLKTEAGKVKDLTGDKTSLANEKASAETKATEAEKKAKDLETKLANVAAQRMKLAIDLAVKEGKIAPGEREDWTAKLANDFEAGLKALGEKKPTLKTEPIKGLGSRRETLANDAMTRSEKVQALVRKEMKETGADYASAFQSVRMANTALFEEMHDSLKSGE